MAESDYRTRLAPLSGYPAQVHSTNAAGLSLWSAYEAQLAYGPGPTAPIPVVYLSASPEQRAGVEQALRDLPAAARSARLRPAHPWSISGRRDVADLLPAAVTQVAAALEQSRAALSGEPELAGVLAGLPGPATVPELVPAAGYAAAGALPDLMQTKQASDPRWDAAAAGLRSELLAFQQGYAAEFARVRPDILAAPGLESWHSAAQEAAGRWFGKRKRLTAVLDQLRPYLRGTVQPAELPALLTRLLAARAEAARLYGRPAQIGGLRLPTAWRPTDPDAEVVVGQAIQAAMAGRALLSAAPDAWALFSRGISRRQLDVLTRAANDWRAWLATLASTEAELARWSAPPPAAPDTAQAAGGWYPAWQRDGATWLAELGAEALHPLHRWATLLRLTDTVADAGLRELRDLILAGGLDGDAAEAAYHRGVAAVSVAERQQAAGLTYFDPEQHDNQVSQYAQAADRLRAALPAHLPTVLVNRRELAAQSAGRLAELATELRRKRGGKAFRELFTEYPDEILALTPCVLVSPASAAFFLAPGAATFDLVVFDEASQIRVAEAIGAMGRGRATVIVGDSKQMPPSSIMQGSHEGDYDAAPVLDVDGEPVVVPEDLDSILSEAVESGIPQRWLSWHYRSRDEALIAFSNRFYYDGKLSSLPAPATGGTAGHRLAATGRPVRPGRDPGEHDRGRGDRGRDRRPAGRPGHRRRLDRRGHLQPAAARPHPQPVGGEPRSVDPQGVGRPGRRADLREEPGERAGRRA